MYNINIDFECPPDIDMDHIQYIFDVSDTFFRNITGASVGTDLLTVYIHTGDYCYSMETGCCTNPEDDIFEEFKNESEVQLK